MQVAMTIDADNEYKFVLHNYYLARYRGAVLGKLFCHHLKNDAF